MSTAMCVTSLCTLGGRRRLREIWGRKPLAGGNYHVYFDNYFSTVKLFEDLLENRVYACGTFRRDRKGVPHITKLGKEDQNNSEMYICSYSTTVYIV